MTTEARNYYIGKNGARKNCAEAVQAAYRDATGKTDADQIELGACGGGRAPGGLCGAAYATHAILSQGDAKEADAFLERFTAEAGALTCRDIRGARKTSCVRCVEIAAAELDKVSAETVC